MKRATLVLATSVALFLSGASVFAATRVTTPEPSFSSIMNAAQGAVGLPYGDPAYFGPEFTAQHTAGSRFQPGSITGQFPPGTSPKVKVPIKPVVTINPAKLAKSVVGALKGGGVPGILGTAAVTWAINQIPGATVQGETIVKSPQVVNENLYLWQPMGGTAGGQVIAQTELSSRCSSYAYAKSATYWGALRPGSGYDTQCWGEQRGSGGTVLSATQVGTFRFHSQCPYGVLSGQCKTNAATPFSDADFDALAGPLSQVTNSDWLRDLTKAKCAGSLSPDACYKDLVSRRPNHGPATQTPPATSSTTTTQNPDGTTSTTTTKTQNKYNYTYTSNSFDYTVTTTSSVTKDGQTTTTTTTEPPLEDGQDPQEEPTEEEAMPEISGAYKPYIDKLNDIKTDVSASPSVVAPLGWSAWYSFGGGCSEINVELPVIGSWSTGYCPYINDWVRPILAFLFAVFTWHYCRELWSEAVVQARPM